MITVDNNTVSVGHVSSCDVIGATMTVDNNTVSVDHVPSFTDVEHSNH